MSFAQVSKDQQNCSTCLYSVKTQIAEMKRRVECRRNAAIPYKSTDPCIPAYCVWPLVMPADWCGEWTQG